MDAVLHFLTGLPSAAVYAILGAGAALENIVPPVPADTFVLLGGFLAGRGGYLTTWVVFAVTWGCNVGSALAVYWIGHRHGRSFFEEGVGRKILTPRQLDRMRRFYKRWGTPAIFLARFLPGLRAVVPAFAGVTHRPFLPVALPVALASAIWYGVLVGVGAAAGRNVDTLLGWLSNTNRVLLGAAVLIGAAVAYWWWRSRKSHGAGGPGGASGSREGEGR